MPLNQSYSQLTCFTIFPLFLVRLNIAKYNISGISVFAGEMAEKGLGKPKVALQFELSMSGIPELIRAEASVEETIMVTEEIEVDEEEDVTKDEEEKKEEAAPAEGEEEKEGDEAAAGEDKKEDEKPKKKKKVKKTVEKEKKKTHKRKLDVSKYHTGRIQPYSDEIREASKAKLESLAAKDRTRIELEEAKNDFESYIYHVKNKLMDDEEELKKISTDEQRETLREMAVEANDWLEDEGWDSDLVTYQTRLADLSAPAKEMFHRLAELVKRPEAIAAVRKTLSKVEDLMNKWETTMPQVTEEERGDVMAKVEEARKWVYDKEDAQAAANPWEPVAFNSADVPGQTKSLEKLVAKLSKRPKPKPVVVEKNETDDKAEDENSAEDLDDAAEGETAKEGAAEGDADTKEGEEQEAAEDADTKEGEEQEAAEGADTKEGEEQEAAEL
jgi:hypothetical protein